MINPENGAKQGLSFEGWYQDVHRGLVASLTLAIGRSDIAEDSADEAIARAYERWDRVSKMSSPTGWTYRVAMNDARRRFRRKAVEHRVFRRGDQDQVAPPAGELWQLVADLGPRQRQAVVLRHVGQLREAEIAEAMGITRGTVSSTLRAAYRSLRIELADPDATNELVGGETAPGGDVQ